MTVATYDGIIGTSSNVSVYFPTLYSSLTPAALSVSNDLTDQTAAISFDYQINLTGIEGSAANFASAMGYAVDGNVTNTNGISTSDMKFIGNFSNGVTGNFFSTNCTLSTASGLDTTYIANNASVIYSTDNAITNVTLGTEYVARLAYYFTGDGRSTSMFNGVGTLVSNLNSATGTTASILNAIDTLFDSIIETTLTNYSTTSPGAMASLMAYQVVVDNFPQRFNSPQDYAKSITSTLGNYNVYKVPFSAGDVIQIGLTLITPESQFDTATKNPNSASSTSAENMKVLINLTLN